LKTSLPNVAHVNLQKYSEQIMEKNGIFFTKDFLQQFNTI